MASLEEIAETAPEAETNSGHKRPVGKQAGPQCQRETDPDRKAKRRVVDVVGGVDCGRYQLACLIDGERSYTYADVDRLSTNLALNLLA